MARGRELGGRPLGMAHGFGREINLAARAMRAMLDSRLTYAGTNFATWQVLLALDQSGQVIQRDLAQRLEVEGPTLVRRLDQLEADSLVVREPSPSDRRATLVSLTEGGKALFKRVRSAVGDTEAELVKGLSPHDVDVTLKTLRHLIERCRALGRSG